MIWNEEGPKPLKINLDLLNYRAKQLERKGQVCLRAVSKRNSSGSSHASRHSCHCQPLAYAPSSMHEPVHSYAPSLSPRAFPPSPASQLDGAAKTLEYCCSSILTTAAHGSLVRGCARR